MQTTPPSHPPQPQRCFAKTQKTVLLEKANDRFCNNITRCLFVLLAVAMNCLTVEALQVPLPHRSHLPKSFQNPKRISVGTDIVAAHGNANDLGNEDDHVADEYRKKLREAEKAVAAAEEARKRYEARQQQKQQEQEQWQQQVARETNDVTQSPLIPGTTVSRTDAGTLVMEWAAPGVDSKALFSGAFSAAWFSAIVPATLSGGASLLFMVPFWLAGGMVAKQALVNPWVGSRLTLGEYAWTATRLYAGQAIQRTEGATKTLVGARPDVGVIVNGVPQYELKLYDSVSAATTIPVPNVSEQELVYLANEINSHLNELRASAVAEEGMSLADSRFDSL